MTGEGDKLGKTGAGYKMGGRERDASWDDR